MTENDTDLIIAEQNASTEAVLKAIAKVESDVQELGTLKSKQVEKLETENAALKTICEALSERIKVLEAENTKLKEALSYYC